MSSVRARVCVFCTLPPGTHSCSTLFIFHFEHLRRLITHLSRRKPSRFPTSGASGSRGGNKVCSVGLFCIDRHNTLERFMRNPISQIGNSFQSRGMEYFNHHFLCTPPFFSIYKNDERFLISCHMNSSVRAAD